MNIYKESLWERIKTLLWSIAASIFLYVVLGYFIHSTYVVLGVPIAVLVYGVYQLLLVPRRRVIRSEEILEVYRGNKCLHTITIPEVTLGFYMRSTSDGAGTSHDLRLHAEYPNGESVTIDMDFLGRSRFEKLLIDLGIYDPTAPIRVDTTIKEK